MFNTTDKMTVDEYLRPAATYQPLDINERWRRSSLGWSGSGARSWHKRLYPLREFSCGRIHFHRDIVFKQNNHPASHCVLSVALNRRAGLTSAPA